jgi:tryptophan 2,3-dioxygenase
MATNQNTTKPLDYKGYLKLEQLLNLQDPLANPPSHDETLFIIIHQVFELWFRLILHEIGRIFELLDEGDALESERLIRRVTSIVRLFVPKLTVLETMIPSDFIQFRDLLKPASGFQSTQFREIEFASGLKDRRFVVMFKNDPESLRRLEKRFSKPSLWDGFLNLLRRRGFAVDDEQSQIQAIVQIYRTRDDHDLRMLSEAFIEYDEVFSLWREYHIRMAQRMIGRKSGTGQTLVETAYGKAGPLGTIGVGYLASTLNKRFFPVLWAARTEM